MVPLDFFDFAHDPEKSATFRNHAQSLVVLRMTLSKKAA
jgi:hypothetical protein